MFVIATILVSLSFNDSSDCDSLNTSNPPDEPTSLAVSVQHGFEVVSIVFAIIGILLNSAFLFTLYRVKELQSATNVYLANLAIADELLLVTRLTRVWTIVGRFSCGISYLLIYMFAFAPVFFISLVALERYMAICRPITHRQTNSRAKALKLSLMAWIASFVMVASHIGAFRINQTCLVLSKATHFSIHFTLCQMDSWAYVSIHVLDFCQFLLACVGNCTLYICIIRSLNKRKCNARQRSKERNHVAKMLSINACVFFICAAPIQVLDLIRMILNVANYQLKNPSLMVHLPVSIAVAVATLNSAVNPIIYSVFNPDYRKAFCTAFTCTKHQSSLKIMSSEQLAHTAHGEEECTL